MANADVSMKINISDTFLTKSNKLRDNILKNIAESSLNTAVLNGAGNRVRTGDTMLGKLNIAFSNLLILLIN